jgi:hypothetical protein
MQHKNQLSEELPHRLADHGRDHHVRDDHSREALASGPRRGVRRVSLVDAPRRIAVLYRRPYV